VTQRHTHHARVVKAFVRKPEDMGDGKVRCLCGKPVTVTKSGRLRRHKTPKGDECTHQAFYNKRPDVEAPPIVIGPEPKYREWQPRVLREERPPSRLDVGSLCETCEKWIPGERSFCGQCLRQRHRL
jgi:hypothetical protein